MVLEVRMSHCPEEYHVRLGESVERVRRHDDPMFSIEFTAPRMLAPRPVDPILTTDCIEYLDSLFDYLYANAITPNDSDVIVRQLNLILQS